MQHGRPAELGERADGRCAACDEHVERAGDEPRAAQARLTAGTACDRSDVGVGREPTEIEQDGRRRQLGERRDREAGGRAVARLPQVREPRARSQGSRERCRIASCGRPGLAEQWQQQLVRPIVAEQVHGHAVGHPQTRA